jgi:hypothetical protein
MAKDYPNRSDLRNPMQQAKFTGQTYGQATQQTQSQQAVPAGPSPTSSVAPTQPVNRPVPGKVVDLMAPSERPQDVMAPIMNNRPTILPMSNPVIEELETLYRMYPNDDLEGLLSAIKYNGL